LRSTVLLPLPIPYRTVARTFSAEGLYVCSWRLDILKFDKLHRFIALHNSVWEGLSFVWRG